eukprot:CAMPEP_0201483856 /NCGR_PEP_ID=MMETSP0151_2-20130828/8037_1 /ASSEMBLY_ACC=CAM_ASM_000257 /TAXON_ID=200890 /ORGANISM="Paramoeba atlantica, Strain 621/1 / CCAP 1560/9" /LENGTH=140 /DNA_ID=CAMNT_0047867207 /DNA_START=516 /DNA_END=938 /DNA_ORIENTATION=+
MSGSVGSDGESSEGVEVEEKEDKGEDKVEEDDEEDEAADDEADDLSWSTSDDEGEEIVISTVTAEITPAQRFRRLFGLPQTDEEGGEGGGAEGGPGVDTAAGAGPDGGSMYIFDYIFAPPKEEEEVKPKVKSGSGCCIIS